MTAEYEHTNEFRDARFTDLDLSGAAFRSCDMRRIRVVVSWPTDMSLSGEYAGLRVNDVDVTAYVEAELNR